MATSSENDDRAESETENESESSGEGGEAQAGEAEGKSGSAPEDSATSEASNKASAGSAKARKASSGAKPARASAKRGAKPARAGGGGGASAAAPPRKQGGSLGKSVVLFVIIVGGLAAAFAIFNSGEGGGGRPTMNWKTGQQVDVELTLVKTDKDDLACASSDELAGRHCGFEAQNKKWSKDASNDEKKLLRPYTTTNGAELLAAGLWTEPALSGTLPATRFSVKCKFTVDGKLKKPAIRWAADRPWYDNGGDWYSGAVTGCTLLP